MRNFFRRKLVLAFVLLLTTGLASFAQESAGGAYGKFKSESEFYYIDIPLEKVYPHSLGYMVAYRSGMSLKRAYLPATWFEKAAGKAQLVKIRSGAEWPHLVVYYKSGQFSHAILYVRESIGHESWGYIPSSVNLKEEFNVEELKVP